MSQKKQIVKLTESQLKGMIAESVKNVLTEVSNYDNRFYYELEEVAGEIMKHIYNVYLQHSKNETITLSQFESVLYSTVYDIHREACKLHDKHRETLMNKPRY